MRRATTVFSKNVTIFSYFYPRSPCGERRHARVGVAAGAVISIHALLAESDRTARAVSPFSYISIHALLAESDHPGQPVRGLPSHFYPRSPCGERLDASAAAAGAPVFLSTLSLRRATQPIGWHHCRQYISIHALLAESDVVVIFIFLGANQFLSTLSLRRATDAARRTLYIFDISIHALLAESDKSTSTK